MIEESGPDFKTKALAVWKLKGKENWENEQMEKANFCTALYRKPVQLSNFSGILDQLRNWDF